MNCRDDFFSSVIKLLSAIFSVKKNLKVIVGHCQYRLKMTFLKEGVDRFIYFII
jgi:hypothetical protein